MTEIDLCLRLEEFYRDYTIYKEVPIYYGGRLDMYVKKGPVWVSVEVKKQFSTAVIAQALRHAGHSHYSFIAVPDLKGAQPAREICKALGIGVMIYRVHYPGCEEWQIVEDAKFRRKIVPYRVLEVMKQSIAGAQHNSMSEYRVTIDLITRMLGRLDGRANIKKFF